MSVDPWRWGEDSSDQDWNNGWSTQGSQQNTKNSGFSGNHPPYSNNNSQSQASHRNHQRNTGWNQAHPQLNQPHAQLNSTADYFSNKGPPVNNNPFSDVENKEIAPPDHLHHSTGLRQPMKLGSRQGQHNSTKNNATRQDSSNNFGNAQQSRHGFPPPPHPPENHHQLPPQETFNPQQNAASSRNQTHHYFTSPPQKDLFESNVSNSWSYFDQMSGPPSMVPQQQPSTGAVSGLYQHPNSGPQASISSQQPLAGGPPIMSSLNTGAPSSSPQQPPSVLSGREASLPPPPLASNTQPHDIPLPSGNFFQDHQIPPCREPQNINYFQMHDRPIENAQIFKNTESSLDQKPIDSQLSRQDLANEEMLQDNANENQVRKDQLPTSEGENVQDQNRGNFMRHDFNENSQSHIHDSNVGVESNRGSNRESPESQILEERTGPQGLAEQPDIGTKSHDRSRPQPPPQSIEFDRLSHGHKRSGPLLETDSRELPSQPPQNDRLGSHERSITSPPVYVEKVSCQEWPGPTPFSHERSPSQGREWPGPFGPDRRGSHEKMGHQRTGSQGSDLSGSLGRDRSGSDRSGSSSRVNQHRPDVTGSRSEQLNARGDVTNSRSELSSSRIDPTVPRPDRVPSRSPGAGEDRSCPARPDNMESLPPESHLTSQLNQLSLQPNNQMDDCPLDRNEYLETSQLSNQESTQNDIRTSRHPPSDSSRNAHGDRREVVGEAEPLAGRVVVGHTTPTATPPPNHSDEVEGGGSGSMERMVVGERREQGSRNNRSTRHRNHRRRESSFEEDDQDYSSDNRRGHRDDYRRDDRHRKKRGQDHRSSDYLSDEDYEIDRRAYSRRDRRGRDRDRDRDYEPIDRDRDRDYEPRDREREYEPRDRDRDYDPDYRRDYYRDDPRRSARGREYYRYDDDEYSFRERSRPSSRSGSDYRRTNLDYQPRNQSRHYFNPALAGVLGGREYEANPEYFEMLRKSNPVLYAIWYQDYMRKLQDTATHFTQSDRASIHSGQSSGNRINISTPNQVLDSNVGNMESFDDYSPRLFSTPHVRGSYDGQGRLVIVNACSPLDGQQASVLLAVEPDEKDPVVKEFLDSPGPFILGVTHRSTVLQYLKKMSDQAVKDSEKLLYDLVHLIVKSNGKPDASDISELLLESYRISKGDSRDDWEPDPSCVQTISHQDMLSTFRNLLHQGNKQEALDWAMKHGGWGHAFFLSSKMDVRTQTRVASEFTRSLAASDPLSSLYQIMSGSMPAAATACTDRRWADWRPHLAIVLSNLTDKTSTNLATVTTLADGLASRGRVYAAHCCYLIAQVMFGDLCKAEGPVLLGCSENSSSPPQFQQRIESFNYKAFLLSLCYEYAVKQIQPNFHIQALQRYKLLIAWRLVEWGKGRQALLYCELLARELLQSQAAAQNGDLIHLLVELSSSLKSFDPSASHAAVDLSTAPDPEWLQQLRHLASSLPQEESEPSMIPYSQPEPSSYSNFESSGHVPMYRTGGSIDRGFSGGPMRIDDPPSIISAEANNTMEPPASSSTPSKPSDMHPMQVPHSMQVPAQPVMPTLQQPPNSLPTATSLGQYPQSGFSSQPPSFTGYEDNNGQSEVDKPPESNIIKPATWEPEKHVEPPTQSSSKSSTNFFHASESLLQGEGGKTAAKPPTQPSAKVEPQKKPDASNGNSGGGWLGGLFGKLSMKPKNQMILPDDKDPSITFDSKLNKWVDRDNTGSDGAKGGLKPPPMGGPTMPLNNPGIPSGNPSMPAGNPGIPTGHPGIPTGHPGMPPASNVTNKYKLQKGKSMKSNYVDIFSNSGTSSKVSGNMEPLVPPMASHPDAVNTNFFVHHPDKGAYSHMPGDGNFQGQEQ